MADYWWRTICSVAAKKGWGKAIRLGLFLGLSPLEAAAVEAFVFMQA